MHAFWQSGVHELKLLTEKIDRSKGAISEKNRRMRSGVVISAAQNNNIRLS
jgi:hypothetical protein